MLNRNAKKEDPDPHQGGASPAPSRIYPFQKPPSDLDLAGRFLASGEQPYLKRLGREDMTAYLEMHTHVRMSLPADRRDFMKELNPELLSHLIEKDMPVVGVFIGGKMVSGAAILYPADPEISAYLAGYDFEGKEDSTAVISAVWTDPAHGGKGLSQKVMDAGMSLAVIDGKDTFRAKVDTGNAASLALFGKLHFDTAVPGNGLTKVYPRLDLAS